MQISPTVSSFTIPVLPVTGNAEFDHFFSLVFFFGAFGYYTSLFARILRDAGKK